MAFVLARGCGVQGLEGVRDVQELSVAVWRDKD
jgi:hypothetical protein